jgi:hypothetical protein
VADVTAASFTLPERSYDRTRATALFETIAQSLPRRPAAAYAFASRDPFSLYREGTLIRLPGESSGQLREMLYLDVSASYHSLLEIPLRSGRLFREGDAGQAVVIVNEAMARALWPGRDPVGESFVMRRKGPAGEMVPQQVVGVVRDVSVMRTRMYAPCSIERLSRRRGSRLHQSGRAGQSGARAAGERSERCSRTSGACCDESQPADSGHADASRRRVESGACLDEVGPILAAALGLFALVLASVGLSGVFAYAVQQRTREIGVRMALGAPPSAVVRLVVGSHSRAVLIGVGVGLAGALVSSIALRARLFGLSPLDPLTYASVALTLAGCGLAATYAPVRRASRISPVVALRAE